MQQTTLNIDTEYRKKIKIMKILDANMSVVFMKHIALFIP